MADEADRDVYWHGGVVSKADREKLNGHRGFTVWCTGLPSSGKSTVARALEERLHKMGCRCYVLDGDNIRHGLNKDLGFSPEDREENIRRIGEVAKLFSDAGFITVTAFISPYHKDRALAREVHDADDFIEAFISCPLDICEQRDPKGLYRRARAGDIPSFTGVSAPYETPWDAELVIETDKMTIDEEIDKIIEYLREKGMLGEQQAGR